MKKNKKATSIIESIIIMLIVVTGVTGMYNIYSQSTRLSNSTANKVQAIQIAREGIEAMTNIRDTNWILFPDNTNCWNTLNYQPLCVNANSITYDIEGIDIPNKGHYIIFKNSLNRWELFPQTPSDSNFTGTGYAENFKVSLDADGFYTQTGAISELKPRFTREILVNYPANSDDDQMTVTSLVQWMDGSSSEPHQVELNTVLTNWKKEN